MASHSLPLGFDFTLNMRQLCRDMVARVDELSHVDIQQVAISFSQTRTPHLYGLQATLTPMRFEAGAIMSASGNRRYTVQQLFDASGREMLYILNFYLPRFLNLPLEEKVGTVLHELWHISPRFDGDLRRFSGRCYAHGSSQRQYDAQVARLAKSWWAADPPSDVYAFLELTFLQLTARYGSVRGHRIPNPKLLAVDT